MKTRKAIPHVLALLVAVTSAHGQGSFFFDQQSGDESHPGEGAAGILTYSPIGQSFTPSLTSVGFIRLQLFDYSANGIGAVIYVNLRSGSIAGPIVSSTAPVYLPDGYGGGIAGGSFTNFLFSVPASVAPGTTYFFETVVQPEGDEFALGTAPRDQPNYLGGTAFFNGVASSGDLWFREGILVPEPSSGALALLGGAVFTWLRRRKG